jgi:hypothetical protein
MGRPGDHADPGIPKKSEDFFGDMARTIVHQKDGIFFGKLLQVSQVVEIGEEHGLNILESYWWDAQWKR